MGQIIKKALTKKSARNTRALRKIALEAPDQLLAWGLN